MTREIQTIDTAIEQVERLYESVTGRGAPVLEEKPYATIPPERIPEGTCRSRSSASSRRSRSFGTAGARAEWKPVLALWDGRDESGSRSISRVWRRTPSAWR